MSENERKKAEEAAKAAGAEWTDQQWPPYNPDNKSGDSGDGQAEVPEENASEADAEETADKPAMSVETDAVLSYLQKHPDEVASFAAKANGGELDPEELKYYQENPDKLPQLAEKIHAQVESGAIDDGELVKSVELQQITDYLTEHPDKLARASEIVNGETDPEEVEYYQQNPDKLSQLAQGLYDVMGDQGFVGEASASESGEEPDAATEAPAETAEEIDVAGEEDVDRDPVDDITDYMKQHPDQIAEICKTANGGELDPDELKYYQDNPDKLPQLAQKLLDKGHMDSNASAVIEKANAQAETDKMIERLRSDPKELERICELTNHGLDPEEVQYYTDHPEKIPQLVEKYESMMANADGAETAEDSSDEVEADKSEPDSHEDDSDGENGDEGDAAAEHEDGDEAEDEDDEAEAAEGGTHTDSDEPEPTEDDKKYEEWLEKAGKRGEDYDPGENFEGESDRAKKADANELHPKLKAEDGDAVKYEYGHEFSPRREDETDEEYAKRLKWEQKVRELSEKFPRFRALGEGEYPEGVDKDAYDRYIANHSKANEGGHFDGADETDEEWLARVGLPSLEEFLASDDEDGEDADAAEGGKTRWSQMTDEEKRRLIRENPRLPGEKTDEWAKRLGIKELVDADIPDDETEKSAEFDRESLLKTMRGRDFQEWLGNRMTVNELESLSDEELQKLYDEYLAAQKEKEKSAEFDREGLLKIMRGKDFQEWLGRRMTVNELEALSDDELQKLYDEYLHRNDESGEGGGAEGSTEEVEVDDPLVAARINREKDARAAAHDIAERMLSERLASRKGFRGLVQRVIIGGMFREGTVLRYERRALEMIQAKQRGEDVPGLAENDWATKSGLERFVQAYVQGYEHEMIHGKAGESMDAYEVANDEDGNQIVKRHWVDESGQRHEEVVGEDNPMHRATLSLREAISDYAQGGSREKFEEAIGDMRQELRNAGGDENALMAENYMAVAEAARARFEHGKAIEDVMAGFSFINGEARSNVRTEAHRDAVDRITNALSNSHIGRLLPPEVVGTAASLAVKYGRSGVRNALIVGSSAVLGAAMAPAIIPVAVGAVTAGAFAAIKERNRVTGDRATQARRLAQGETIGNTGYDESMREAQYSQHDATAITKELNDAIESGDQEAIHNALALAETAVMMSDERGIDLIRYTSGDTDQIEQQRMDMDVARARAKAALRREGVEDVDSSLTDAIRDTTELFERDISAKDKAFRRLRRRRMAAQGLKSAAISGVASVASQEVVSLFRDDQVGVLENLGVQVQENRLDAQNTLLAGALGFKGIQHMDALAQTGAELTQQEIDQLRADGYTVVPGNPKVVEGSQEVSTQDYLAANDSHCERYLGYDKGGSQGNELRGYFSKARGPYTDLRGVSYGGGQSVDTESIPASQVGFFATFKGQNGYKLFIPATGSEGHFEPDYDQLDPAIADVIRSGGYSRIQCGFINGTTDEGDVGFSSFWSMSGRGTGRLPDTITTPVATSVPTWDVIGGTSEIERAVDGYPTFAATSRKNLTLGTRAEGQKPDQVGGTPHTHTETNPTNGGGDNTPPTPPAGGSGESVDFTPPTNVEVNADRDDGDDDGGDDENGESSMPASPEVRPTPTGNGGESLAGGGSESDEAGDDFLSEIPYEGPIRPNAINLYLTPTEQQIREAAKSGRNLEIADADMRNIQMAIATWNGMSEDHRRHFINGGRLYDKSSESGFGGMSTREAFNEQRSAEILQRFGLVETGRIHSADTKATEPETTNSGPEAPKANEPETPAAAESSESSESAEDDDDDDDEVMTYDVPFTGAVNARSEETRTYPSDEDIRSTAIGVGRSVSDEDRQSIRNALFQWNTLEEEERRDILGKPAFNSASQYGDMPRVLSDYGLIQLPRFEARNEEAPTRRFAPRAEEQYTPRFAANASEAESNMLEDGESLTA